MNTTWTSPFSQRMTARQSGLITGILPPGRHNDICDVPGVMVGHATVVSGDGALRPGKGPVRTGVTAILPHAGNMFAQKVPAGLFVLNGFGKSTGLAQVQEMGTLETPILLTNTLSVFRAADALVGCMLENNPSIGITGPTVNPVVGECNDGYLNDIQGRHITEEHVRAALADAGPGPVRQGVVGAGTGVVCFGFKGGIGSASRRVEGYSLGALVQANFGRSSDLLVGGVRVESVLAEQVGSAAPDTRSEDQDESSNERPEPPPGSIMVVLATDAPLDARQLTRLCRRGALGLGRVGGSAASGSGEFILSFSTACRVAESSEQLVQVSLLRDESGVMNRLFLAAVEAVEEAVLNALFTAQEVRGRDGNYAAAFPAERLLAHRKEGST